MSVRIPEYFKVNEKSQVANSFNQIADIQLKAKNGIKVGDIQNEAHMAYIMAVVNENQKKYSSSIKFLKRFYFCAKLLDDYQGAEIALNKIGIAYHLGGEFQKSLNFHYKHQ